MDVRRAVALAVVLPAALLAANTVVVWLRTHAHVPIFDSLLLLPLARSVAADGFFSVSIGQWLELFGGAHRILAPRLLLVADDALFAGKNHLSFATAWLSIAALLWVFTRTMWTRKQVNEALVIAGIALAFLFSPSQLYNMLTTINATWFVTLAAAAIAFSLLLAQGRELSGGAAATVLVMGPLAAFGSFAGIILCVMVVVLALLYEVRHRWLIATLLSVFVGLYLIGVQSSSDILAENPRFQEMVKNLSEEQLAEVIAAQPAAPSLTERVANTARLVASELSLPVYRWSPAAGYGLSALSIAFLTWCWLRVLAHRIGRSGADAATPFGEFYLAMATLCLGIVISIYIGRDTAAAAGEIRYRTVCMGYWMSVLCLGVSALPSIRNTPLWAAAVGLAVALSAAMSLGGMADYVQKAAVMGEAAANAQTLGTLGVRDFKSHRTILPLGGLDGLYAEHYDYLATRQFSADNIPAAIDNPGGRRCDGLVFTTGATSWPGVRRVRAQLGPGEGLIARSAYLYAGGRAVGMLFPTPPQANDIAPWLMRGSAVWRGYYRCKDCDGQPLTVMFVPLLGSPFDCQVVLGAHSSTKSSGPR